VINGEEKPVRFRVARNRDISGVMDAMRGHHYLSDFRKRLQENPRVFARKRGDLTLLADLRGSNEFLSKDRARVRLMLS